jgi:uncharacterized membrane protein
VPGPLLTLSYALHLLATVVLVGGLFVLSVLWLPAASRSLSAQDQASMLRSILRRFQPLAWLSMAVLAATGLMQMAADPNYQGFLQLGTRWSAAMLAKHAAFAVMVVLAGVQTWGVTPALEREALQRAATGARGEPVHTSAQTRLLRLNFWLGLVILGLTTIAQTA